METTQMQYEKATEDLCTFIENSPSCYHAVANAASMLERAGFCELRESEPWKVEAGGKYFVLRNGSALIAFSVPDKHYGGFNIISSHSDSPTFKIKEHAEIQVENHYTTLNVEGYGGMLCAPWFDRPLSIAGRVLVREGKKVVTSPMPMRITFAGFFGNSSPTG